VFDLDGVLVDTARFHFEGWRRVARSLGFDLAPGHGELLKGISRREALDVVLAVGGRDLDERARADLAEAKNAWYVEQISHLRRDALLPGVEQVLDQLHTLQVPIALASSSKNARMILRQTGIEHCFDAVVDGHAVTLAKPDPEIFVRAAKALGMKPSECVVFEDAAAGVAGAHRAGCFVVGLGDTQVLSDADFVVGSMAELNLELLFG
jgi:beta-phosphoglucomutase